jgi:hypothetical protein
MNYKTTLLLFGALLAIAFALRPHSSQTASGNPSVTPPVSLAKAPPVPTPEESQRAIARAAETLARAGQTPLRHQLKAYQVAERRFASRYEAYRETERRYAQLVLRAGNVNGPAVQRALAELNAQLAQLKSDNQTLSQAAAAFLMAYQPYVTQLARDESR